MLARWLLFLGIVDQRKEKVYEDIFNELEAIAMEDKNLCRAFEKWEVLSGTKEEVAAYRARMKRLFDEESMIGEAEMRGEERGREKGREEGRKAGEEKGKEETAMNMWRMGLDIHIIAEATGLTKETVRKIVK